MSLFDTWPALAEEVRQEIEKQSVLYFEPYTRAVCGMVARDARLFSRLGDADEGAYAQLARLTAVYNRVAGLIENSAEPDPAVNAMLAGIYDILQNRIREFENNGERAEGDNPVAGEKQGIVDRAVVYTQRQIENQAAHFHEKVPPEAMAALRRAYITDNEALWQDTLRALLRDVASDEMYTHYRDGLRFCLLGLDNLHTRKIARRYTEELEREWEVLQDMIRVQAQALEEALSAGTPPPYASEVPRHVLTLLREAYQQTHPAALALQKLVSSPRGAQEDTFCTFDDFALTLAGVIPPPMPPPPDAGPFLEALTAETDALFGAQRITFLKAAYRLQRMIGDEILLTEEASAVFKTAYASLIKDRPEAIEAESRIINGIIETLEIKIDALKDGIADFNGETASLLQAFAKEKNDYTDEIKEAAYPAIRDAWLDAPPPDAQSVPAFFAQCQERDPFAPSRAEYERHVNHYNEKMEKAALRFRKEILLYEIATYEEILTHSVSRLRESDNALVQATAARLEGTYAALVVLLKKNNVTPIRPKPHDPFNGKEHEVLLAEKQEGFEKGEIIKCMGSGYRYKDRVLVRANVIAAK